MPMRMVFAIGSWLRTRAKEYRRSTYLGFSRDFIAWIALARGTWEVLDWVWRSSETWLALMEVTWRSSQNLEREAPSRLNYLKENDRDDAELFAEFSR